MRKKNETKFNAFLTQPPYNSFLPDDNLETYNLALSAKNVFYLIADITNPENGLENYFKVLALLHMIAFDPETVAVIEGNLAMIYSRQTWLSQIGDPLVQGNFDIQNHIAVDFIQQDNGAFWMKTRGMINFGKPDIAVHDLPEEAAEDYLSFLNSIALDMTINNYLPEDGKELVLSNHPTGMKAIHSGSYDDDEYWGNVHIELAPPIE